MPVVRRRVTQNHINQLIIVGPCRAESKNLQNHGPHRLMALAGSQDKVEVIENHEWSWSFGFPYPQHPSCSPEMLHNDINMKIPDVHRIVHEEVEDHQPPGSHRMCQCTHKSQPIYRVGALTHHIEQGMWRHGRLKRHAYHWASILGGDLLQRFGNSTYVSDDMNPWFTRIHLCQDLRGHLQLLLATACWQGIGAEAYQREAWS
mmetsp:Transcript_53767/g.116188  ORF Transcript_53767/g.116188 Transcript_53767/m.116188 type:complete len:204 (+) Transcript_53767:17-628(+)